MAVTTQEYQAARFLTPWAGSACGLCGAGEAGKMPRGGTGADGGSRPPVVPGLAGGGSPGQVHCPGHVQSRISRLIQCSIYSQL